LTPNLTKQRTRSAIRASLSDKVFVMLLNDLPILGKNVGLRRQPAHEDFTVGGLHGHAGQDVSFAAILLGESPVMGRPKFLCGGAPCSPATGKATCLYRSILRERFVCQLSIRLALERNPYILLG
jgi:hypothetical protein